MFSFLKIFPYTDKETPHSAFPGEGRGTASAVDESSNDDIPIIPLLNPQNHLYPKSNVSVSRAGVSAAPGANEEWGTRTMKIKSPLVPQGQPRRIHIPLSLQNPFSTNP